MTPEKILELLAGLLRAAGAACEASASAVERTSPLAATMLRWQYNLAVAACFRAVSAIELVWTRCVGVANLHLDRHASGGADENIAAASSPRPAVDSDDGTTAARDADHDCGGDRDAERDEDDAGRLHGRCRGVPKAANKHIVFIQKGDASEAHLGSDDVNRSGGLDAMHNNNVIIRGVVMASAAGEEATDVTVHAREGEYHGGVGDGNEEKEEDGGSDDRQEHEDGLASAVATLSRSTSGRNCHQYRNRRRRSSKDPDPGGRSILRVHVADIMTERDARLLDVAAELAERERELEDARATIRAYEEALTRQKKLSR